MIEIKLTGSNMHDLRLELSALHDVLGIPDPPGFVDIDLRTPPLPPAPAKRTRRTKAEIEAAKAASEPAPVQALVPVPQEVQPPPAPIPASFDDDEPVGGSFLDAEPAAKPATKEDAKSALVALQLKRAGLYVQGGMSEKEAGEKAQADALAVLKKAGGVERFSTLPEAKYGAVMKAANEEAAK